MSYESSNAIDELSLTCVEELHQEAIAQANRYADTYTVKRAVGSTQLHKVVVVYKGMEMRVCEEVTEPVA